MINVSYDGDDAADAAYALVTERGWGDGLPIIPPTADRVQRMIAASGRHADDVLAELPPQSGIATIRLAAVNAVMAGCSPDVFPIVLAAIEALADPRYELHGTNTTTNPCAPLLIINGPIRNAVGLNSSWGVMGPYFRSNATIGRAVSLCLINIAGRIPGRISKGTYKVPGAFTMCAGEAEEESPWESLHTSLGFKPAESTVTVLSATGTTNVNDHDSLAGEDLAKTLAQAMCTCGTNNWGFFGQGEIGLMICPPHARLLATTFPTRRHLQEYFHETCRIPLDFFPAARIERMRERGIHVIDDRGVWVTNRPEQYLIFVAGGPGGYHSCIFPSFGDSYAVTRVIRT